MNHNEERNAGGRWKSVKGVLAWLGLMAGVFLILLVTATKLAPRLEYAFLGPPTPTPSPTPTSSPPKAAIVDQTGFSFPSPEFIEEAKGYLQKAGYRVDFYPSEEVTIEFYRTLPEQGYRLILLQTHSTSEVVIEGEGVDASDYHPGPFLFTTELYDKHRHLRLQMDDQVRASKLLYEDSPALFAIGPKFVRKSMEGRFEDTLIIIGGCQSLAVPDLAWAFLDRGASMVIGWDGLVDLSHNNRSVLHLLRALSIEELSPQRAVEETIEEVGPDPTYGCSLILLQRDADQGSGS